MILLSPAEIVKLLVRPHDGLLIWQSNRTNTAPKPTLSSALFHIRPAQTVLNPLEEGQVKIVYDPAEAVKCVECTGQLNLRARALGYVTEDHGQKIKFSSPELSRTSALETDRITLSISAEMEKPG